MRSFVYCRQRTDERLRRGGEQKSVVVLAAAPHASVLRPLSQHAGALYFNRGPTALAEVRMHLAHACMPRSPLPAAAHPLHAALHATSLHALLLQRKRSLQVSSAAIHALKQQVV